MDKVGDPRMTKNTQGWKCRALPNAMGHAQGRHHGAIHGGTPMGEGGDACVHGVPVGVPGQRTQPTKGGYRGSLGCAPPPPAPPGGLKAEQPPPHSPKAFLGCTRRRVKG